MKFFKDLVAISSSTAFRRRVDVSLGYVGRFLRDVGAGVGLTTIILVQAICFAVVALAAGILKGRTPMELVQFLIDEEVQSRVNAKLLNTAGQLLDDDIPRLDARLDLVGKEAGEACAELLARVTKLEARHTVRDAEPTAESPLQTAAAHDSYAR
jgi:hypothetical protein